MFLERSCCCDYEYILFIGGKNLFSTENDRCLIIGSFLPTMLNVVINTVINVVDVHVFHQRELI